ncbi:MAG TPA: DUF5658 family protein [Candidatus Dormibacteraeota bacterium]
MGAETELKPRVHRVGVGIVEIVPDDAEYGSLRAIRENLSNRVCALLVAVIVFSQIADIVTTYRALSGHRYVEDNPFFRGLIVRAPLAAYAVKLLIITAMILFVLSRLYGRYARIALAIAAGISLSAPLLNFGAIFSS